MIEYVVNWYATRRHISGSGSWSLCNRASGCKSIISHREMLSKPGSGWTPPDYDQLPVCKFCVREAEKLGLVVEDGKPLGPTDREIAEKARALFEADKVYRRSRGDHQREWFAFEYEQALEDLLDLFKEEA